jgi:hypothetical protein
MKRFNYILPMLVGVLAFANFLWMMTITFYGLAGLSFFIAVFSLGIAIVEHGKYQNYLER